MRRLRWFVPVLIGLSVLVAGLPAAGAAPAGGGSPGDTSGGDPYFPSAGNGGYDVLHYDLVLDYTPRGSTGHRHSCRPASLRPPVPHLPPGAQRRARKVR